jgi:hypothetical protein
MFDNKVGNGSQAKVGLFCCHDIHYSDIKALALKLLYRKC